jgi:hypothetical protein
MRRRYEAGFEGRRREIMAGVEHRVEKAIESLRVALHHLGVALRALGTEVQPEHAANRLRRERYPMPAGGGSQPVGELPGALPQGLVEILRLQQFSVFRPAATATGLPDRVPA